MIVKAASERTKTFASGAAPRSALARTAAHIPKNNSKLRTTSHRQNPHRSFHVARINNAAKQDNMIGLVTIPIKLLAVALSGCPQNQLNRPQAARHSMISIPMVMALKPCQLAADAWQPVIH
jgi:hypothetical protein